jgi:hypothetical protein
LLVYHVDQFKLETVQKIWYACWHNSGAQLFLWKTYILNILLQFKFDSVLWDLVVMKRIPEGFNADCESIHLSASGFRVCSRLQLLHFYSSFQMFHSLCSCCTNIFVELCSNKFNNFPYFKIKVQRWNSIRNGLKKNLLI